MAEESRSARGSPGVTEDLPGECTRVTGDEALRFLDGRELIQIANRMGPGRSGQYIRETWLGRKDSNLRIRIQSPLSYH